MPRRRTIRRAITRLLPERRRRLGLDRAAGADHADAVAARALGPAHVVPEAQDPLRRKPHVLALRLEVRTRLADHRERRGSSEEDDGLLVGGHDYAAGARSANLA